MTYAGNSEVRNVILFGNSELKLDSYLNRSP